MALQRHHKIIIGGTTTILIIFMITISILVYTLFIRQEYNRSILEGKISDSQADTQNKINELTNNLIQTKNSLSSLDIKIGSVTDEIDLLKSSTSADFSGIIEDAIKSVVTIRTDIGQGTGFIISDDGYIVTNSHVLAGGSKINAITYEQETISANFIGYNNELDIALIKIEGEYNSIRLSDSDKIQIGEKVIAIGNPLGLQFSVSEGIVSAVNRPGPTGKEAYIQTDAALNPGNSGGPLINKQGRVIGINNFKIGAGESLGFALESNYIEEIVNEISQKAMEVDLL